MSIDRSRRVTFEENADLYDEVRRPNYPEEITQDIIDLSGIPDSGRILEIGCGTGQATLGFAKRGYGLLAIELGQRLAALAARNLQAFPEARVINVAFENWVLEEKSFDLALSSDAFHWIPPEIGYPKVAQALKDTGSAAFFWTAHDYRETELARAVDEVYQTQAPGVTNPYGRSENTPEWLIPIITANFENVDSFAPPEVRRYHYVETFSAEQYIKWLRTYSGHRVMSETQKSALYQAIGEVIERHDGTIEVASHVTLFHARIKRS